MTTRIGRRGMLAGSMALGAGGALANGPPARGASLIDVSTPERNLHYQMKLFGDAAGGNVLWWYFGTIYAMIKERGRPEPLCRIQGCKGTRFVRHSDSRYTSTHHSIAYMEDLETQELLEEWVNPLTGETRRPEANVFAGSEYEYTVNGWKMGSDIEGENRIALTPGLWRFGMETAWLNFDRAYAPRFGYPWGEFRHYSAPLADLADPATTRTPWNDHHSSVTNPFPAWMGMQQGAGFALWHVSGRKLRSLDDLPEVMVERARTHFTELFDYV